MESGGTPKEQTERERAAAAAAGAAYHDAGREDVLAHGQGHDITGLRGEKNHCQVLHKRVVRRTELRN